VRLVLASSSPARLQELLSAGIDPVVRPPGVDESAVREASPERLATTLAALMGEAVLQELGTGTDVAIVACDSVLDLDSRAYGKPGADAEVRARWAAMRGHGGTLLTGHHVGVVRGGAVARATQVAATQVRFADITDDELEAYIATGEPQRVAGAFTIDGYGAAFVSSVTGDPHNVVGISIPLVRLMLADLGVSWTSLWRTPR